MDLFNVLNSFYDKNKFEKISDYNLSKNFFMINRFCSINYPLLANNFNHLKINGSGAVKSWQMLLSRKYSKSPYWMYIKIKKDKKETGNKEYNIDENLIKKYCELNQITKREFSEKLKFFGDKFYKEVIEYRDLVE